MSRYDSTLKQLREEHKQLGLAICALERLQARPGAGPVTRGIAGQVPVVTASNHAPEQRVQRSEEARKRISDGLRRSWAARKTQAADKTA